MPTNMIAILNMFVESKKLDSVANELSKLPDIRDLYEVTGEYDLVAVVTVNDALEFRRFLKDKVLKIDGVKSTVTSIVLYKHKEQGTSVSS